MTNHPEESISQVSPFPESFPFHSAVYSKGGSSHLPSHPTLLQRFDTLSNQYIHYASILAEVKKKPGIPQEVIKRKGEEFPSIQSHPYRCHRLHKRFVIPFLSAPIMPLYSLVENPHSKLPRIYPSSSQVVSIYTSVKNKPPVLKSSLSTHQ